MKRIAVIVSAFCFISCQQQTSSATEEVKDTVATVIDVPLIADGDTVTIGDQLYDITPVTAEEFNKVPEWKSDTSEAVNILKDSAHVRRAGDSLILTLANGQEKILVNNITEDENYAVYTYAAYLPAMQHFVVFNVGYEWHSYELYNFRDGEMTRTIGFPEISPDKKHFICSNTDLVAAFTLNGFQLFQLPPSLKPILLQERELENWGANTIKWKDGRTLVAWQDYLDKNGEVQSRYIRLTPKP